MSKKLKDGTWRAVPWVNVLDEMSYTCEVASGGSVEQLLNDNSWVIGAEVPSEWLMRFDKEKDAEARCEERALSVIRGSWRRVE